MGAGLSLTEVDSAEDGSNGHNQRKCTIMFELSINLLRVLEFFTAKYVPAAQHAASMLVAIRRWREARTEDPEAITYHAELLEQGRC